MDQLLFLQWLRNVFDPSITAMGIKRPILLIIDGTLVHLLLWISKFCDEKYHIICVVPKLNPPDTTVGSVIDGLGQGAL